MPHGIGKLNEYFWLLTVQGKRRKRKWVPRGHACEKPYSCLQRALQILMGFFFVIISLFPRKGIHIKESNAVLHEEIKHLIFFVFAWENTTQSFMPVFLQKNFTVGVAETFPRDPPFPENTAENAGD